MRRFVVQRHRARRLHYDLRLEIDGVLVSWAVPRGPSLDAGVRRLAVQVDDHDLDYFDFEGVLPAGMYGAGDVIVWDWGTWSPGDGEDPAEAVRDGEIHLDMVGEKLAGRFVLIRTDGRSRRRAGVASRNAGREQWLLLHKRDEHAVSGWDAEQFPRSVKTGRTNEELRRELPEWRPGAAPG